MRRSAAAAFAACLVLSGWAPARADDVTDSFDRARKAYEAGQIAKTREEIGLAGTLLAQKRVAQLAALLPAAPRGWTAKDVSNEAGGAMAMAIVGISAERVYERGDQRLTLSVIADSPIVAGLATMLRSGLMGMAGNNRVVRIQDETALYDESDGSLTMVVDGRILLKGEGDGLKLDDLKPFLEAVKLDALKKL